MTAPRLSHEDRESVVIAELEKSFPNFTGRNLSWVKVPDGEDPPDFISPSEVGPIGLELVKWLDGLQMGAAKRRESRREGVQEILSADWASRFKPKHFRAAFPSVGSEKIPDKDQPRLRDEFFACAEEIDRNWESREDSWRAHHLELDFSGYPVLKKYLVSINFISGEPGDECWVHQNGDGGAFDPYSVVRALEGAFENKIESYVTPEKQAHLKAHGLVELDLLVHGDSDTEIYNTSAGHLKLAEISKLGAASYSSLPERDVFKHVWFFHWVDTFDELNQALGFAPGAGRVRWLAQLWPEFVIYKGSIEG